MSIKPGEISISTSTIFKILAIAAALWLAYLIKPILLILFVALILAALIDPFADFCERKKIPRGIGVIAIYIVIISVLTLAVWVLVPPIVNETQKLAGNLGSIWERALAKLGRLGEFAREYKILPEKIDYKGLFESANVGNTVQGIFSTIGGVFVGIASVIITFVMAFYMVVEEDAIKKLLRFIVPTHYQPFISQLLSHVRGKLGAWLRAQLILSVTIGVLVYIGLLILGVEYAAVLAIVAAVLELIPYVGPVLAGAFAVFLSFADSGVSWQPVFVFIMFILIQQVENNILVPKVMQKSVGLNPIVSIVSMLVGAKLAGFVGILLAIPVATLVSVFIEDLVEGHEH